MKALVIVLLILLAIGGGYLWYTGQSSDTSGDVSTYTNASYGISFKYPNTYASQERELGNGERYHYAIALIDKKALANIPQNGEGPTSITMDVFQNALDQLSVEQWIRGSGDSNFKLSPGGVLTAKTVAGVPAFSYVVDGLYRNDVVVFAHPGRAGKGNIIMLSVSYFSPKDQIRADFAGVLSSIALF